MVFQGGVSRELFDPPEKLAEPELCQPRDRKKGSKTCQVGLRKREDARIGYSFGVISDGRRELGSPDFRLREITPGDSQNLYRWRMDATSRPMFRSNEPVSPEKHAALLSRYFAPDNGDRWFIIEARETPVGAIVLHAPSRGEAEWGRLVISPEARGRGYGRRALTLLIEHARQLGLSRLRCEVLAGNAAAEAIYGELGFRETGREEVDGRTFRRLSLELGRA